MFRFLDDVNYMMPAHFGGYAGAPQPAAYHEVTSFMIAYETDLGLLAEYIPDGFEITQPVVSIQYSECRGVDWLSGGGYHLITVAVPVTYAHGQERIDGLYVLVIWEDQSAPILTGREQTGMPKIFANIEDHHQLGDRLFTNASYEGSAFLRMDFQKTKLMTAGELRALNRQSGKVNAFGWRYIPNIGRPGAALSHATLFPQEFVYSAAWLGDGRVQWEAPTAEQNSTQAHIIQALSQLPIKSYRECVMTLGSAVLRNDLARQLP